jgi:hypothetical protein
MQEWVFRFAAKDWILERAMGIEPRHDYRYVADTIGYSCQLPSKTGHNRVTDAKKPRQISSNSW